jgi:AraC-like DNA-binding protein
MKVYEKGVNAESNIYFHTPQEAALRIYFYPICCGHFYCSGEYLVNRDNYDSFLLMHVKRGDGFVCIGDRRAPLQEGDTILLDCYSRHSYGAGSSWETVWAHFDGAMARAYFDAIARGSNCTVLSRQEPRSVYRYINSIYGQFHEKGAASDALNNKYIVNALTEFLLRNAAIPDRSGGITEDLLAYIADNIQLPLKLAELAEHASLSPYYFTRLFKKETGYTPHKYVLMARVNAAKFYLKSSMLSIKEITFACGFSSECSFCATFKRLAGTTPMTYRNSHTHRDP